MRENKMSVYAAITALIFAIVALAHIVRIINRWAVQIGLFSVHPLVLPRS